MISHYGCLSGEEIASLGQIQNGKSSSSMGSRADEDF
jgi:hypothetical protein